MKNRIKFAFMVVVLALFGCGDPVPQDKLNYVGEWQSGEMYLSLTQDGHLSYKRVKGNATTEINGPLKGFNGNNIEVGLGFMSTSFVVSKPPYKDGDKWKMVVDGVELVRIGDGGSSASI